MSQSYLEPKDFFYACVENGIEFFTGVPDSLLKDLCAYVTSNSSKDNHLIAANEGNAIALAAGYHLATGKHAMVYLQNSGLGNTVNPLMSLTSASVNSIPMLLLIGWRGEPGTKDEPQHLTMGEATPKLLEILGIPYQVLPSNKEEAEKVLEAASQHMTEKSCPFAILVRKQTFSTYPLAGSEEHQFPLKREEALITILDALDVSDVVVCTTGMASRELFEYREKKSMDHQRDFLTVGSMGHASSIALGIALQKPDRQIFCLDGDGAAIMHMGSMATIGQHAPVNFNHVIINNGSHDSVGGQPTVAKNHDMFSFLRIADGCGYKKTILAETKEEIKSAIQAMKSTNGPVLLEVKVTKGARKDVGRPTVPPIQNKKDFMNFLTNVK